MSNVFLLILCMTKTSEAKSYVCGAQYHRVFFLHVISYDCKLQRMSK